MGTTPQQDRTVNHRSTKDLFRDTRAITGTVAMRFMPSKSLATGRVVRDAAQWGWTYIKVLIFFLKKNDVSFLIFLLLAAV